jgi:hypothetical protein
VSACSGTKWSRQRSPLRNNNEVTRLTSAVAVAMAISVATPCVASPQQRAAPAAAPAAQDDAALRPFQEAVERYVVMQRRLRQELPGLQPNSTAKQITDTSDALARAIQRARQTAKPGDIFAVGSSRVIKQRVADLLRQPQFAAILDGIEDEVPLVRQPRIHLRYPAADQMATMPPSLLQALPKLPPELEYRLVGRYLVLRDTYAGMIVDYLAEITPPRK